MPRRIQILAILATLRSQAAHSWDMADSWQAEGDFDTADTHADNARHTTASLKAIAKRGGRPDKVALEP